MHSQRDEIPWTNGQLERPPAGPSQTQARHRPLSRAIALGAILGVVAAAAAAVAVLSIVASRAASPLTEARLAEARMRWAARAPANYALEITVYGRQAGEIQLSVRDGEVVELTRDGVSPRQRRTWEYWSVPGQFDMIEQELVLARDPQRNFGAPAGAEVSLRAEFDADLGYPTRYQRSILGLDQDMGWTVTKFETVGPDSPRDQ